ncbi:MAG: SDR family NAD(P)-dependent oxidoreductase [Planctomycetes bacterium]|nr:SDR family NAD(P)-dependent oxidoreductase [Planctomycetota bacterium]
MLLTGRHALVTGASSGIGLAIARELAAGGARVALMARRLGVLKEHAAALGENAFALRGDVRELRSMQIAADHVKKKWGAPADLVVANAGVAASGPVAELAPETWNDLIATNLTGAFHTTTAFLPDLLAGPSDLVFIASIAGTQHFPHWAAYCASKFGLIGFARSLREEVRPQGVRVTIVVAGAVDTGIWPAEKKPDPAKMLRPEDVARAVVQAVSAPAHVSFDEVRVLPAAGIL